MQTSRDDVAGMVSFNEIVAAEHLIITEITDRPRGSGVFGGIIILKINRSAIAFRSRISGF